MSSAISFFMGNKSLLTITDQEEWKNLRRQICPPSSFPTLPFLLSSSPPPFTLFFS